MTRGRRLSRRKLASPDSEEHDQQYHRPAHVARCDTYPDHPVMAEEICRPPANCSTLRAALHHLVQHLDSDASLEQDDNIALQLKTLLQSLPGGKHEDEISLGPLLFGTEQRPARHVPSHLSSPTTTNTTTTITTSTCPSAEPLSSTTNASSTESAELTSLRAQHSQLQQKFRALDANFKIAKAALRRRVDERAAWVSRAKYLERVIDASEKMHNIKILPLASEQPPSSATDGVGVSTSPQDDVVSSTRAPSKVVHDSGQSGREPSPLEALQVSTNTQVESTQGETDDESSAQSLPQLPPVTDTHPPIKPEPSSDEPVVVSERAVRKVRHRQGTPDKKPKLEPAESLSPVLSEMQPARHTQENVDLGEIEKRIATPRKQRESGETSGPSTSAPSDPVATLKVSSPPQKTLTPQQPAALAPRSVNVQRREPTLGTMHGRRHRKDVGLAIAALAEDGDDYRKTPVMKKQRAPAASAAVASAKGRLQALLNTPSAAPTETALSCPPNSKRRRIGEPADLSPVPRRRTLPFNKEPTKQLIRESARVASSPLPSKADKTPKQATTGPKAGSLSTPAPGAGSHPQQGDKKKQNSSTSLRNKPLSDLQPDDFKINPLANDGHDFAFADVVRDKADRACLPGCTDMHCCGKQFRALALSQRPDPPLTPAQRIEERSLLERYLGDGAYRLAGMDSEGKAELWVEAKTQELADKYGKHRHRFARMRSPPGFWDADFPSTQELERDKSEAARRERRTVSERFREAMRPGGRWLFKDE